MLALIGTAFLKRLHWAQWSAIGIYLVYLSPYIGASYYERYAAPLLAVKVLLVIWAVDQMLSLLPRKSLVRSGRQVRSLVLSVTSKRSVPVPLSH